jgi:hypothetical protein
MTIRRLGGVVVAFAAVCIGRSAHAQQWLVTCPGGGANTTLEEFEGATPISTGTFPADPGGLGGTSGTGAPDALGALLGTPDQHADLTSPLQLNTAGGASFNATLAPGQLIVIDGICTQDIEIKVPNLTIIGGTSTSASVSQPAASPPSLASPPANGIAGEVVVTGAPGILFDQLLFGSATGTFTLPASTAFSFAGDALVFETSASSVDFFNSIIANSSARGLQLSGASAGALESSLVTQNGVGDTDPTTNMGVQAAQGSSLTVGTGAPLGQSTGADSSTISNNGGDGIRLSRASSLQLFAGTVSGNGNAQLFIGGASAALLDGNNASLVTVTAPSTNAFNAIDAEDASNVLVEYAVTVTGGTSGAAEAIYANGGSSMTLQGSFISGGIVTIEATGGSLVELAGGNYICNGTLTLGVVTPSCTAETGDSDVAVEIDHVGALNDVGAIAEDGFPAAADTIIGGGILQLQSTADLGAGQISGQPSLVWTTGANDISVAQNSSLRLEGGVNITGAIDLAQGSNGFVNLSKSPGVPDTNTVSAGILCPFVTVPDSHLQLGKNSLATSTPPTTEATSFAGATSPQCLPF